MQYIGICLEAPWKNTNTLSLDIQPLGVRLKVDSRKFYTLRRMKRRAIQRHIIAKNMRISDVSVFLHE